VMVALLLLEPSVPVMTAEPSVLIEPAVTLKPALELLAVTVTLAGAVSRVEVEVNEIRAVFEAGCESVTIQEPVLPDIKPVGLQDNEDTWSSPVNVTVVLAELPL